MSTGGHDMTNPARGQQDRQVSSPVAREERYGGYSPGKNSTELKSPKGLRSPALNKPRRQDSGSASTTPSAQQRPNAR